MTATNGAGEVWRRVLGFTTTTEERAQPGKQIQHMAVLHHCEHEVPVPHGHVPGLMRCPECERHNAHALGLD